jgi:hypothetical protein
VIPPCCGDALVVLREFLLETGLRTVIALLDLDVDSIRFELLLVLPDLPIALRPEISRFRFEPVDRLDILEMRYEQPLERRSRIAPMSEERTDGCAFR